MKKFSITLVLVTMLCVFGGSAAVQSQAYDGMLRVFMVEPEGRWEYATGGATIHQAFLGFSLQEAISVPSSSTITLDAFWDAGANGFSGVTADNFEAIAGVYAQDSVYTAGIPDVGYWFWQHDVDAAAAAQPGVPGMNESNGSFTHTVLMENASKVSCPNCPGAAEDLSAMTASGDYLFHYVTLVRDRSAVAEYRAGEELYVPGEPSCYYDGGFERVVGDNGLAAQQAAVTAAGARAVPDVGLVLRVEHIGGYNYLVTVRISNAVAANSAALAPDAPTGDGSGAAEDILNFQAVSTDPDGDDLYYQFDFGDSETSDWLGPYSSGTVCPVEHVFASDGLYDVRVRTKDVWASTSELSPSMTITVDVASDVRRRDSGRLPTRLALGNYPNPFNPTTIIGFSLPRAERVELTIYNILGERVRTLVDDNLSAGNYEVTWDGTSDRQARVSSGIYLYRLTTEHTSIGRKMLLLK